MLYDNSLFIRLFSEFYAYSKEDFYKEAAYDVIDYLEKNMRLKENGIASAEDADSEGEEGKFYLWDFNEIQKVCQDDFPIIKSFWNITKEGHLNGKNILHESLKSNSKTNLNIINQNKKKLLVKRNTRIKPLKDDKVITSWNALYIQSLAKSGMFFSDLNLINLAEKTFSFFKRKFNSRE